VHVFHPRGQLDAVAGHHRQQRVRGPEVRPALFAGVGQPVVEAGLVAVERDRTLEVQAAAGQRHAGAHGAGRIVQQRRGPRPDLAVVGAGGAGVDPRQALVQPQQRALVVAVAPAVAEQPVRRSVKSITRIPSSGQTVISTASVRRPWTAKPWIFFSKRSVGMGRKAHGRAPEGSGDGTA